MSAALTSSRRVSAVMNRSASASPKPYACPSIANSAGSSHTGTPSVREMQAKAQRGSSSFGYHLPCPRCSSPPGAVRSRNARINSSPRARLAGPSAAKFHCRLSGSSMPTNVGSPPMVSRTSCVSRSRSTACASARTSAHASSLYGVVRLAAPPTRRTLMAKLNSVRVGSTVPPIGAVCNGVGATASGICPSAVNSPEVASIPIHPAPGRYTSAQACRSTPSTFGPVPASEPSPAASCTR